MKIICALVAALAVEAGTQEAAPPDMTKVGPLSRPVTKEDKAGVDALFKAMDDGWKKGDLDALADNVDFPVIMLSDDSTGAVKSIMASREQWMAMMKPFLSMPKDMKMSHKHTAHFLSDTLAVAIGEDAINSGPMKGKKWKSMSVLNFRYGRWKIKQMAEAGWGDMQPPTSTATAPGRTPTNTVPHTK